MHQEFRYRYHLQQKELFWKILWLSRLIITTTLLHFDQVHDASRVSIQVSTSAERTLLKNPVIILINYHYHPSPFWSGAWCINSTDSGVFINKRRIWNEQCCHCMKVYTLESVWWLSFGKIVQWAFWVCGFSAHDSVVRRAEFWSMAWVELKGGMSAVLNAGDLHKLIIWNTDDLHKCIIWNAGDLG